jgi:hypothetical protein
VTPEEEEEEAEEFEPAEEGGEEEVVDEFESVEDEEEVPPEVVEEFDGFDENAPDDITTSGMKTKGGDIPGYEPTVDEVLSYAMGKTTDPSEPVEPAMADRVETPEEAELPPDIEEALDEILDEITPSGDEKKVDEGDDEELDPDELADVFDEDKE